VCVSACAPSHPCIYVLFVVFLLTCIINFLVLSSCQILEIYVSVFEITIGHRPHTIFCYCKLYCHQPIVQKQSKLGSTTRVDFQGYGDIMLRLTEYCSRKTHLATLYLEINIVKCFGSISRNRVSEMLINFEAQKASRYLVIVHLRSTYGTNVSSTFQKETLF